MFRPLHPCFCFRAFGWSVDGAMQTIYNVGDHASMLHPGLGRRSSCCEHLIRLVALIVLRPKRVFTRMELSSSLQVDIVALIEMHRTRAL